MEPITVAVAFLEAELEQGLLAGVHRFDIGAFGHEEDFRWRHVHVRGGDNGFYFLKILAPGNHEFELVAVALEPLSQRVAGLPCSFVPLDPCGLDGALARCRIGEFGTDRGEVAGNTRRRDGSSSFYGDVLAKGAKLLGKAMDSSSDHGFSAGEHAVAGGVFMNLR